MLERFSNLALSRVERDLTNITDNYNIIIKTKKLILVYTF